MAASYYCNVHSVWSHLFFLIAANTGIHTYNIFQEDAFEYAALTDGFWEYENITDGFWEYEDRTYGAESTRL